MTEIYSLVDRYRLPVQDKRELVYIKPTRIGFRVEDASRHVLDSFDTAEQARRWAISQGYRLDLMA